jgi:V8-like Glu-specific endopeptidase
MRSILILFALVSSNTHASIFGNDDRIDTKEASPFLQNLARSVPALIQKKRMIELPDGSLKLEGPKLTKMGFCSDEPFAEERQIANCSASLIGKNKILTAAHCLDYKDYACETYSVVFDYQRHEIPMTTDHIMNAKQVYSCKKIDYYKFDETIAGEDLAIIELDRDVEGRTPVELDLSGRLRVNDPLLMIGYPLGISQKVVVDGVVTGIDKKNVSFKHTLDSFSVNSGGPIFSVDGKQVGVLVRGTGANFEERNGEECARWHIDSGNGYSDANYLSPLKRIVRKLKL